MKKKQKIYILTDQCFWQENAPKGYNTDPKRKPHAVTAVDVETGTIQLIPSGSRVIIVPNHETKTTKPI